MRRPSGRLVPVLLLLAAVAILAWSACSRAPSPSPRPQPEPPPQVRDLLRVGTLDRPAALPLWGLKRILRMRGLRLDIQLFEDPGRMWEMLSAGQLDVVLTSLDQFALFSPRHNPGVLVMPTALSQGSDVVVSGPDARRARDLQGQRLAFVEGSAGGYLALKFRNATGVRFHAVAARNAAEAAGWLRQGQVQAAALWAPWTAGFQPLWSSQELQGREQVLEVWVASAQVLKGEGVGPDGLSTLAEAWFWVIDRLNARPFRATAEVDAIAEESGQGPARVQAILESGLHFLSQAEASDLAAEQLVRSMHDLRAEWSFQGEFEPPLPFRNVPPENVVDLTILDALPVPDRAPAPAADSSPSPTTSPPPSPSPAPSPTAPSAPDSEASPPAEADPSPGTPPGADAEAVHPSTNADSLAEEPAADSNLPPPHRASPAPLPSPRMQGPSGR